MDLADFARATTGDYSGNGVGIDLELRHSVEDSIQDSMVSNESFNTDEENNTLTASYSNENNAGAIQDSNITGEINANN